MSDLVHIRRDDWEKLLFQLGELTGIIAAIRNGRSVSNPGGDDTRLLDWAESHPEKAMASISSWWGAAGRGARENQFNFRFCIRQAMAKAGEAPPE